MARLTAGIRARTDRLIGAEAAETLHGAATRMSNLGRRGYSEARAVQTLRRAGVIGLHPAETLAELRAINDYGQLGAPVLIAALKHGDRIGLVDELGSLTFAELHARSDALAAALARRGIGGDDTVGVLCRNHRGFLDITFAAAKRGARILYLNTDFSGPQLRDVCRREQVSLLVHDEEYDPLVTSIPHPKGTVIAWHDRPVEDRDTLEDLIQTGLSLPAVGAPERHARIVLLTSGTTGTPKGAPRSASRSIAPIGAMLSKVPYRAAESTYLAPPMFHGVGFSQMLLSLSLGCTLITERRFDAERVVAAVTAHRPTALVLVPVMLRRIVGVLERRLNLYDLSSLRIVFVSGSALEAELVRRAHASIGRVLYNFYGSTEVAYATFATPEDLVAAPGCAGRPPFGTVVRIYDDDGRVLREPNRVGRIFVGNSFPFDGYTGGGSKPVIDGLMSTGDLGHFDAHGRLWVDGRDDDMIVSGGENLFPGEVEELLATHPGVEEAAVIGVEDPEYGQRLAAFIVRSEGSTLDVDQVQAHVKGNLARFKVPRDVHFLDELPRNPTGKVLKRRLRELHRELGAGG
ncbi:AMP-binding protein [Conexibacter sp. DBS9H8]|uniref:AMP-binding protein n=1 Tax=Conexibacter sp. DBS9H8 TaxID=2937801 RepID=UPI00200CC127|nr:AMP-binding protein [Conexibacter sp. DBS9H8]